jgi:hypothetical protein
LPSLAALGIAAPALRVEWPATELPASLKKASSFRTLPSPAVFAGSKGSK